MVSITDIDRLEFPKVLAPLLGMSVKEVAFLKQKGCPFYGRKSTVRWIRAFLAEEAGAKAPSAGRSVHPTHSASSKSGAPSSRSGSPVASLRTPRALPDGSVK
jgi:hypothetical protein